ncbi:hypothetical protein EZV62_026363 [Acer yangbiense]|uniref:Protein kinase domain-containing protein n=1 Tax=Acer yangbiense TaxID=1000413 RepID=A0A5C7GRE6_9ROSI|nr:hypothetical protein EZV62_026363 [Acer yangbiense]
MNGCHNSYSSCRAADKNNYSFKRSANLYYNDDDDGYNKCSSFVTTMSCKTKNRKMKNIETEIQKIGKAKNTCIVFTYQDLVAATNNFDSMRLVGKGGFGMVYKGYIERIDQVVAVKQLNRNGNQGSREFFAEAKPLIMDKEKFKLMVDPLLEGRYPLKGLYQALAVAAMCIQEEAVMRPKIGDVVTAIEYLINPDIHEKTAKDASMKNDRFVKSMKGGGVDGIREL